MVTDKKTKSKVKDSEVVKKVAQLSQEKYPGMR